MDDDQSEDAAMRLYGMEAAESAVTYIKDLLKRNRPISETQQMFLDLYRDAEDLRETNLRQTTMLLEQQEEIIRMRRGQP